MLRALPTRVIYLSVPDLEWCFGWEIFFFFPFWQITCIVDVNSISNEKCQNNQGEKQNLGVPT